MSNEKKFEWFRAELGKMKKENHLQKQSICFLEQKVKTLQEYIIKEVLISSKKS